MKWREPAPEKTRQNPPDMGYRLTERAKQDLIRMYREGVHMFGWNQAESYYAAVESRFEFLAHNPRAARERTEITPSVRAHPFKSHVILYVLEDDDMVVIGIRNGREDWMHFEA